MTAGNSYPEVFGQRYPERYPEDFCDSGPSLAALGSDLLRHWEVPIASSPYLVLNGSNVASVKDRAPVNPVDMSQANAGLQLPYSSSGGGANGIRPYATIPDATSLLYTGDLGHLSGKRLGIYTVQTFPGGAFTGVVCATSIGPNALGDPALAATYQVSPSKTQLIAKPAGSGAQTFQVTNPAFSADVWQIHSIEFLATGLVCKIGSTATTPALTGNDFADAFRSARWGHPSLSCIGAKVAAQIVIDNADAARRALVLAYLNAVYGFSVV